MHGTIDDSAGFAVSWTINERGQRSSHALVADGGVWIIDPIDWAPALERVATLGEPTAVVQLLDRHARDSAKIAARLGIPHLTVPDALPASPFEVVALTRRRWWRESALWWPQQRTLVVPEAIGTVEGFSVAPLRVGVHPALRLTPPKALRVFAPAHLLVGHGPPLHGPAAAELGEALSGSRRELPKLLATLPGVIRRSRR